MSADNTIIVLTLKDCYRVTHCGAADNLYFSYIPKHDNSPVPARVFEYFEGTRIFKDDSEAFKFAFNLYNEMEYVEYGVQTLDMSQYTWEEIVNQAKTHVQNEIGSLNEKKDKNIIKDLRNLIKVLDGKISIGELDE